MNPANPKDRPTAKATEELVLIGARIRELRLDLALIIKGLAKASVLSVSMLSWRNVRRPAHRLVHWRGAFGARYPH